MERLSKILLMLLTLVLAFSLLCVSAFASAAPAPDGNDEYEGEIDGEDGVIGDSGVIGDAGGLYEMFSESGARIYLIAVGLLLGIALPAVPLVIFTVKAIKKKSECEVVDYIIIGLSAAWLAVGIGLFIILL